MDFLCFLHGFKISTSEIYLYATQLNFNKPHHVNLHPLHTQHISIPEDGDGSSRIGNLGSHFPSFFSCCFCFENEVLEIIFGGSDPAVPSSYVRLPPDMNYPASFSISSVQQHRKIMQMIGWQNEIFKYTVYMVFNVRRRRTCRKSEQSRPVGRKCEKHQVLSDMCVGFFEDYLCNVTFKWNRLVVGEVIVSELSAVMSASLLEYKVSSTFTRKF